MGLNALGYLVGAGSMSLGVEAAGFHLNEIWETPGYGKNAESWKLNRPEPINLLELDWQSEHFHQYQGLDLIYGNPPCGGLSSMTCSRIGSPTNNCMRQWIRMVVQARPRMILMENAYQLATDRIAPLLQDLTSVLDLHDYWWWTWTFYSYQIGTPQVRRRMFLCATLDQPIQSTLIGLEDLPPSNAKDACPCGPYLQDLTGVAPSPHPVTSRSGAVVTQHYYNSNFYDNYNRLIAKHRDRILKPYVSPRDLERIKSRALLGCELSQRELPKYERLVWPDMPKEFGGMSMHRPQPIFFERCAPAMIGAFKFVHPVDDRVLTMREMARLMGYPDTWQFHTLRPHLVAQGIPAQSAKWAADRMLKIIGAREIG